MAKEVDGYITKKKDMNFQGVEGVDKEIADNEEFRLIKEIVMRIVKEYNFFRKELQMSYNEEELENGIITI